MTPEDPLSGTFMHSVSTGPGVYQMLGKQEVLYVGKAVNLRKRLASYKRFAGAGHSKTSVMLSKVVRVETILTTTEKEALILEASLIKKHRPRYNVILRDDKNYPLIKVTMKDKWPRIIVTRQRTRDGSRYFGPFSSTSAMRKTLKLIHSIFPLRRCKTVKHRERPCLNFQMGRCLAPCAGHVSQKKYSELVNGTIMVLDGRNRELLEQLKTKMNDAAKSLHFEVAATIRDQIKGLTRTLERQIVVADHVRDQDIFGLARNDASIGIAIVFVRSGMVSGVQSFFLPDPIGSDEAILTETIVQYYSARRQPPSELLLPFKPEDWNLLIDRLTELREDPVKLLIPQRGKLVQLIKMANRNAVQVFSEQGKKRKSWNNLSASLVQSLRLYHEPNRIECIDISNIGGKQPVGALVCFQNGDRHKSGYRHYHIQGKNEPDDYAMMREVIHRRLEKGIMENDLPGLLLLDGGKGQLNLAKNALHNFGLTDEIDLVAIAKEKKEEGEKLFRPGRKNPILLPRHSPVLLFLMRIRDEAHRFGITHHRKLRNKTTLTSELDALQGVGKKRKSLLLKTFGSLKRLKNASPDQLRQVSGIGPALAESLYTQLHNKR